MTPEQLEDERKKRRALWRQRTCAACGIKVFIEPVIIDYMADDDVWKTAGFEPTDLACLGCFEDRLPGRTLKSEHLSNALTNRLLLRCVQAGFTPWRTRP